MMWLRGTSVSDSYNLTELSNLFTVLIYIHSMRLLKEHLNRLDAVAFLNKCKSYKK